MAEIEQDVENYLVDRVELLGGEAYKFTSPGRTGVPDRLCVFEHPVIFLVECKKPGETPRKKQLREQSRWKSRGFKVYNADTKERVDDVIEDVLKWISSLNPTRRARKSSR